MGRPCCDGCGAPADLVDNYDTFGCWDCWDDGGRDKPHNLVIRVLRHRDGGTVGGDRNDGHER
jgi:hypothetical protein